MPSFFEIFASRKGRLAEGRDVERVAPEGIIAVLNKAVLFLQAEVQKRIPRGATGLLRGSVASEVRGRKATLTGLVGSPLIYALPVETGTRPHFPPVEPIAAWAQRKLNLPYGEARLAAYAIARAIGRRGTKGAKMFARTLKEEGRKLDRILDGIVPEIVEGLEG